MNARKAHNTGRNHVANVRDYFASLGHDKAQNIIDAIIQSHETGGRAQMMAAPSMRIGAGFMNPMATGMQPSKSSSGTVYLEQCLTHISRLSAISCNTIPTTSIDASIPSTFPTERSRITYGWYAAFPT